MGEFTKADKEIDDCLELKNWDNRLEALGEAWKRGFDYAKLLKEKD